MPEEKLSLVFLFECEPSKSGDFERKLRKDLEKELAGGVEIKVEIDDSTTLSFTAKGKPKLIDSVHGKLNNGVCRECQSIRLTDDLGERLRINAFVVLATLEPRLRSFINEAMTRVLGFSWWEKLGDKKIKGRVADVEAKNREGLLHHPIEFSEFDHLVDIVTGEMAHWDELQPVSVKDLIALLSQSTDVAALKSELEKRTNPESLWETVFAPLFDDQKAWLAAKDDLVKVIIPIRHRVSHHRPIRMFELEKFEEAAKRVIAAIDVKKRRLQEAEMTKLHDKAKDMLSRVRQRQLRIEHVFGLDTSDRILSDAVLGSANERMIRSVLNALPEPPTQKLAAIWKQMEAATGRDKVASTTQKIYEQAIGLDPTSKATQQVLRVFQDQARLQAPLKSLLDIQKYFEMADMAGYGDAEDDPSSDEAADDIAATPPEDDPKKPPLPKD